MMKRPIVLVTILLAILFVVGWVLLRQHEYARETYQGRHTRDWAWVLISATNESSRAEAAVALRALGPKAVPPLRRMLQERDKFYEKPVVDATRSLPANQRRAVLQQLKPGQAASQRLAGAMALGLLGTNAEPAIRDLVKLVAMPDGQAAWEAERALVAIGEPGIRALVYASAENPQVRYAALYALRGMPTNAAIPVDTVLEGLLDPDDNIRLAAAETTRVLKLDLTEAVKARMNSREVAPQIAAIRALMLTQAPARAVGTNLIAIASNSTGELRRAALEALGSLRVSTTGAVMLVKAALDDSDPAIRIAAMKSAGALSWKTADIIPSLIEFTRSADANERAQAAETLGNYTTQSTNVLPALQRLLQDPDLCVRTAATNEVRRMESAIGAK